MSKEWESPLIYPVQKKGDKLKYGNCREIPFCAHPTRFLLAYCDKDVIPMLKKASENIKEVSEKEDL